MPEKKLYDLTVDPEFRDLIPPLNEEELKLLEESLAADGCESPLIVWNGASTIQVQQMVVRDEQDIRSLAVEIATLTRRQQRGKGLRMA